MPNKIETLNTEYVHPEKHAATMITEDANHKFITEDERIA